MADRYQVRLINEADTQAVLDIYRYYVDNTIISFEYEAPSFEEFAQRIATSTAQYPWLVCLCNDRVVGYAYGSTHRYRTAYQWSPESTIYLAPDSHTRGIGRILYESLLALLKLQGYFNVFAGVALPNEKSVGFHLALGFEEIGVFSKVGYKHGGWHDTQWFQLALNELTLNPAAPMAMEELVSTKEYSALIYSANDHIARIRS